MIIAVDALAAFPGKSGAVGAIRNMMRIMPRLDSSVELIVFVNHLQYDYYQRFLPSDSADNVSLLKVKFPSSPLPLRLVAQNVIVPRLCRKYHIDVHFSMNPEPVFGIPGVPEVFKVVDLQYFDVPEEFGLAKTAYRKWMGRRKAQRAKLIIANSLYTKAKIVRCLGVEPDRIRVVYEALDHEFFNADDPVPQELDAFKKRYSLTFPFIIYVSSFRPYKNHMLLLQAFRQLREKGLPYHLVLVGNDIKGYRRQIEARTSEMQIASFVHFFDYVHHWDLKLFYEAARLAVYPSELETFGIPPLEAMACAVPIIVSNTAAIPEISGGGALVVDPHDVSLMAASMHQVLEDEVIRREMISRGRSWCSQYTWQKNIAETVKVIKEAIH